jgi:hypothetical protein
MDVRSRWRVLAPAALLLLAALVPSAGYAVANVRDGVGLADFDARAGAVAPSALQKAAVKRLGAAATWNRFGTPQTLFRARGSLSKAIHTTSAAAAARRWVAANKSLYRLRSTSGLRVALKAPLGRDGRAITFRQRARSAALLQDGYLTVALRRAGKAWRVVYASSSLSGNTARAGRASLRPTQAWLRAVRSVGRDVSSLTVQRRAGGWTYLKAPELLGTQSIRAGVLPTRSGFVPAYEAVVENQGAGSFLYRLIVDGRTGRVLLRQSLTDNLADNPVWKVFQASPRIGGNAYPWNYPSTDNRRTWCWLPAAMCDYVVSTGSPHPNPWDVNAATNTPTLTTIGNNATDQEQWVALPLGFPNATSYRPTSATRDYVYPWTNVWFTTLCSPTNLDQTGVDNDIDAATANLFAMHNRVHDWSYNLGFTEANWNAQTVNINPGTLPNDEVVGNAQAAAVSGGPPNYGGRDNANMTTRPDGTRSTTNMFLWQPLAGAFYAPCVDGDFDMSVIGHEYGHMIENRMIGKGVRRQGDHAGAMGESFGDMNAMEYLNEYGFVPTSHENRYAVGPYVTSNPYRGIRNYAMNFPYSGKTPQPSRYPFVNPLNLSDVGYDFVGAQVHADGEIWSATNFDIRRLLIGKYGYGSRSRQRECADGDRPVEQCPGNRRWFQLYYDAMLLMPVAPSFLDARNSILAADMARFGGANQRELWYAFASRGMGESAFAASGTDNQPRPAFDSPESTEATVKFRAWARDEHNAPVNATIYVGHYEARVSPTADTDPATGPADGTAAVDASNLDNTASFVSRQYEFLATAPGYGFLRFRASLRRGEHRTIDLYFATNWASKSKGAVATGDGIRLDSLIDDTESTNWESNGVPVQGRQVTIALGGGKHELEQGAASAQLVPTTNANEIASATQNRFTALRAFELRGCAAGAAAANPTCDGTIAAGWQTIYRSAKDFFPSDPPRPVTPELILRGFDLGHGWGWNGHGHGDHGKSKKVTHVQFVVVDNECTGETAYQGEQDNDPLMNTDCRTGTPPVFPGRANDVRAAEVQLYSSEHKVKGAELAGDEHGHHH